jgi:hypothetical protein
MSYEALIAAQAKRLTKKRERRYAPDSGWLDDWRGDCRAENLTWGVKEVKPINFDGWHTYADLYVPPAPERVELSHTEWADGYQKWRDKIDANPEWFKAQCAEWKRQFFGQPCCAENEI